MRTSGSGDPLGKELSYFLLLVAVAITLFQRAFPSQDGPLHLYYSDVLSNLLRGTGAYADDYQIKHLLPPYAFQPYLLVGLSTVFSPLLAEKLLVSIYIAWFALAFRYLVHSVDPGNEVVPLFAVPFAMNRLVYLGFYNFSLGVATAMFFAGFWLRNYDRLAWRRSLGFAVLVALLASMHPVALLVALMFVGVHLGCVLCARFHGACGALRARAAAALVGSARPAWHVLAAFCMLGWISAYTPKGKIALLAPDLRRLKWLIKLAAISPLHSLAYRALLAGLIGCLVAAAGLRLFRTARALGTRDFALAIMAVACVAIYVLVPWEINGGAHFPDRFPIFALLFLAAFAAGLRLSVAAERRIAAALGVVVLVCLGWQAVLKHKLLEDLRAVYDAPVPSRPLNAAVVSSVPIGDRNQSAFTFLPDYWAAAHYLRRAHARFLNDAWLDAQIMILKPRAEGKCSYSDAYPMLQCLSDSRRPTAPQPELLVATNGGGSEKPTDRLAQSLGLVRLPVASPFFQFYARPELARVLSRNQTGKHGSRILLWGGPPGPRPTPSSAFAGPRGPARTRASAPLFTVRCKSEVPVIFGVR